MHQGRVHSRIIPRQQPLATRKKDGNGPVHRNAQGCALKRTVRACRSRCMNGLWSKHSLVMLVRGLKERIISTPATGNNWRLQPLPKFPFASGQITHWHRSSPQPRNAVWVCREISSNFLSYRLQLKTLSRFGPASARLPMRETLHQTGRSRIAGATLHRS